MRDIKHPSLVYDAWQQVSRLLFCKLNHYFITKPWKPTNRQTAYYQRTSRSTRRCPGSNVSLCMANSFWKGFLLNQPPYRPCLGPPDPWFRVKARSRRSWPDQVDYWEGVLPILCIKICLKMIDTWGPGPSGSGFRAQKYDPPPLKQTFPTILFYKMFALSHGWG